MTSHTVSETSTAVQPPSENVDAPPKARKSAPRLDQSRFVVKEFINPSGDKAWRVDGYKRGGKRIRENFPDVQSAQCRQIELETEYLRGYVETTIRATKLSAEQVQLAEVAFLKLGDDWLRLLDCVDHWQRHGKHLAVDDSPKIDDAVDKYLIWLDKESGFRDTTKRHWKTRIKVFKNSVANHKVCNFTPELIEKFLDGRDVSPTGKDTDKRAVSRFFSWCIERPRRWAKTNPCKEVKIRLGEKQPPKVLTVKQCRALLKASKSSGLAPYVAICLFGGLRPFEVLRMTWAHVNLKDREIRLEGNQTKTGTARVVPICDTLHAWLSVNKKHAIFPKGWTKKFAAVRKKAKIKEWPADVLRHTAISHHFRLHQSYGKAAEQFGNSEAIIKAHYQGRVSSDDTKKFYKLLP